MSVSALTPVLRDIRADGTITLAEANTLTAPRNGVDLFADKDTFSLFTRLAADITTGNKLEAATPETVAELNKKDQERQGYKGLNKGGLIGGALGTAILIASSAAILAAVSGYGVLIALGGFIPLIAIGCLALAGFAALIGKKVAESKAKKTPITKAEARRESPRVLKAAAFKKNPLVQRGIKIAGILGGSLVGVTVAGIILSALASGAGAALLPGALFFGLAFIATAGVFVAALIGVGALGGFIHSRIKQARNEDDSSDPVTASPEALAVIDAAINQETPSA